MADDVSDISGYYDGQVEQEHSRLERNQLEWDLTWRFLETYLPAQGSILEIGAATGRYTLELAKRGYRLTSVDLSPSLLEACRRRVADAGLEQQVHLVVADARDLSQVTERGFDAVLLMGPLYHLVEEADRTRALNEAYDRLRQGGMLFSAFISRFGLLGYLLRDKPDWIDDQVRADRHIRNGRRPIDQPRGGFRGYFAQPSELAPLHEALGFETIAVAGVEPAISADDESYNRLQGDRRRLWLDLLYQISTEPSIVGASRHLLYVGRKA